MNRLISTISVLIGTFSIIACSGIKSADTDSCLWMPFSAISGQEEYPAIGVSAMYAGVNNKHLFMAGGANFPDVPASDGGKKAYYRQIFTKAINKAGSKWNYVGDLPESAAYGASVSTPSGIICIGGNNESSVFNKVLRYQVGDNGMLQRCDTLPELPCAMDNFAAANDGNVIYVAGGNMNGVPGNRIFRLEANKPNAEWNELDPFPGFPRVQPVLSFHQEEGMRMLVLAGGFCGYTTHNEIPVVSKDVAVLDLGSGKWEVRSGPVSPDNKPISLGGACVVAINDSLSLYTGGVNDSVFLSALDREKAIKIATVNGNNVLVDSLKAVQRDYLLKPVSFYKFNPYSLIYNVATDQWTILETDLSTARAGAMMVTSADSVYLFNGEAKPGIRTGSNCMISIKCVNN